MQRKSRNLGALQAHRRYLAQLLSIGAVQLEALAESCEQVTFPAWSDAVREAGAEERVEADDRQLEWLWQALTTEPAIVRELGGQILYPEDEWRARKPVPVLRSGHVLGIFLKNLSAFGSPVLPIPSEAKPDGWITLLSVLMMGPGKATSRRFECQDVNATVQIQLANPGSREQEATMMKLQPSDIVIGDGRITTTVRSLNHALTVASRRLEARRRGEVVASMITLLYARTSNGYRLSRYVAKLRQGNGIPKR